MKRVLEVEDYGVVGLVLRPWKVHGGRAQDRGDEKRNERQGPSCAGGGHCAGSVAPFVAGWLVGRRLIDVFDHHHLHRSFRRIQLKPKLLLNSRKQRR